MKTLVIWFIDKLLLGLFVLFLIGAFLFGYMGGDLVTSLVSQMGMGIEGSESIHEDAQNTRILFGILTLFIGFIIGSLVFGFFFLLLNIESNIRLIRQKVEELSV